MSQQQQQGPKSSCPRRKGLDLWNQIRSFQVSTHSGDNAAGIGLQWTYGTGSHSVLVMEHQKAAPNCYVPNQVDLPSSLVCSTHRIITLVNTNGKAFLDQSDSQESTY
jgi:hypothetical protein